MDLVANELYDLSDDSENEESYRYEDFFGRKKSSAKDHDTKSEEREEGSGDESEELPDDFEDDFEGSEKSLDGSDEAVEEESDAEEENSNKVMTTYGKEKQKLQERIANIESELVEKKSWERRGEVMSGDRPENSLLGLAVAVER